MFTDSFRKYSVIMAHKHVNKGPHKSISIPLDDLICVLDIDIWSDSEGRSITPREVLKSPLRHVDHVLRIKNADLRFPILVYVVDGKYKIMDGVHRVCLANIQCRDTIDAIDVTSVMEKFRIGYSLVGSVGKSFSM